MRPEGLADNILFWWSRLAQPPLLADRSLLVMGFEINVHLVERCAARG